MSAPASATSASASTSSSMDLSATAPSASTAPTNITLCEPEVGEKRKHPPSTPSADNESLAAASSSSFAAHRGASSGDRGGRGAKRGRGGSHRGGGGGRGRADSFNQEDDSSAFSGGAATPAVSSIPSTPLQQQFSIFASYLDARNDRREAIYQSSRDLTRQSKKLISQLQRCTQAHASPHERAAILQAGHTTLSELHRQLDTTLTAFTQEEYHRYSGAYSPGVQEFIEAASFLHYLEYGTLLSHAKLETDIAATTGRTLSIPLSDYIVGILDLGGELMRFATNSVTSGDRAIVSTICSFLREVYSEYSRLQQVTGTGGPYRELTKKMEVWLQSLMKIEALSYKLHIRGAEIQDSKMLAQMIHMQESGGGGGNRYERDAGDGNQQGDEL